MGSNFTALYDACVLYPAPLRDLLMQLALTDLFRARWTEQIHDEWIRNVLKQRPDLTLFQLTRTKELMNSHVRDCLVTGYEYLIPSLKLPDPDDRHVLAAAIKTGADFIVTFNLSDFPQATLEMYEIEALHPDDFISDLIDLKPALVRTAAETCRLRLRNPITPINDYFNTLLKQGLSVSVSMLRELYDWS
ncbi:MAG TPA: PIN domain-containing protein [Cyanobacteria bacterium UBA11149]|nr:PIN domain-containing protein [Cyanobacteria bacterium UBA11367]HBE59476.1 PIN domain-containing protein [Cyanobacteria bacterium UBA11366]HBK63184.1 PIN domain-containing protein [Cyanobacteria bacterium UBA11166]HBR75204.1 PIN domain-containing protein [Cyanobacteria bacterium UBA11159]HBS68839.1 PIN domain-containing protein [Cyanobacteria bacterium UBA11153]HBW88675.1 PIN domain-containing protein [Cyanobacteria bacterium UBA11149]HCA94519.1 PIN domain-containing protein [Cyanobacteria